MSEINSINLHVEVNDLTKHVAMNDPGSAAIRDLNVETDLKSVEIPNTSVLERSERCLKKYHFRTDTHQFQ